MTGIHAPEERTGPEHSCRFNSLLAAINFGDRFNLLEDDSVLPADLDNPIHPIFRPFDCNGPRRQTLQLATQFLTHDSVLSFFVPLLFGRTLTIPNSEEGKIPSSQPTTNGPDETSTELKEDKTYLSDPFTNASPEKKAELISRVRDVLLCLADCVVFRIMPAEEIGFGNTSVKKEPGFTPSFSGFQQGIVARIKMSGTLMSFYDSPTGYAASTRCAQFRHDFLFAVTLVHEIVHAVGVMRRGTVNEPYIRTNHPSNEWGWAWENYMFGAIINPRDQGHNGIPALLRMIWSTTKDEENVGGTEYCDVSMSYISKWFYKETWALIAKDGPTAIPPPITRFRIQISKKYCGWLVSAEDTEMKNDLFDLVQEWWALDVKEIDNGNPPSSQMLKILFKQRSSEALQKQYLPVPIRVPTPSPSLYASLKVSEKP